MAIVMDMEWPGVTREQYDANRNLVRWEIETPEGNLFHVAWFTENGVRVVDVWESEEHWNRFLSDRLLPGVQELGIPGQPNVQITEAHRFFSPQPERLRPGSL